VSAGCCLSAGVVGPCTEELSFMCTQALLRVFMLFGGFLDQVLKRSGREEREWSWLTPRLVCVVLEQAVLLPALGLACLSPDIAESSLVWWSACCCGMLDLGKIWWLCLALRGGNWGFEAVLSSASPRLALLRSCYLTRVLSFPLKLH